MDVVRSVLDKLKGTVHISTQKACGTTFQLRAPLTLASIQTLLFRVGGRLFAVPLSSVVEISRINEQEIHRIDQREVLRLRDQFSRSYVSSTSAVFARSIPSQRKRNTL